MSFGSSFDSLTRRLDIGPATQDTTYEKALRKSRAIGKIPYKIYIPDLQLNAVTLGALLPGCLLHQINYTAPLDFKILSAHTTPVTALNQLAFVAVRYRVGTTVHRYRLPTTGITAAEAIFNSFKYVQAPLYSNQTIKANFVIEVWTVLPNQSTLHVRPIEILTGLLAIPASESEVETTIDSLVTLVRGDLIVAFPEILPTVYNTNSSWLTN